MIHLEIQIILLCSQCVISTILNYVIIFGHFYKYHPKIYTCIVISPNTKYEGFIDKKFIYQSYSNIIVQNILAKQNAIMAKYSQQNKITDIFGLFTNDALNLKKYIIAIII